MKCKKCGESIPESSRLCPACGEDAGFPNVRLASNPDETSALKSRLQKAEASATAANYHDVLTDFGNAAGKSKAVIARPLRLIDDLINDPNRPYTTFHKELSAGIRTPEDNIFDRTRTGFENALFPNFFDEIRFAALTLDGRFLEYFGRYAFILKEEMIEHRATVFEENPYKFVRRHKLNMTDRIPPGYRAKWAERGILAQAKLYSKLDAKTKPSAFPEIMMSPETDTEEVDYLEVHIYGAFNQSAIEKVVGETPKSSEDKIIWRRIKKKAKKTGIKVEKL